MTFTLNILPYQIYFYKVSSKSGKFTIYDLEWPCLDLENIFHIFRCIFTKFKPNRVYLRYLSLDDLYLTLKILSISLGFIFTKLQPNQVCLRYLTLDDLDLTLKIFSISLGLFWQSLNPIGYIYDIWPWMTFTWPGKYCHIIGFILKAYICRMYPQCTWLMSPGT